MLMNSTPSDRTSAKPWSMLIAGMKAAAIALSLAAGAIGLAPSAQAHGERNQEPFLRMRTLHWYDLKWSASKLKVNDELVVTGRVRAFEDWPNNLPHPLSVFLSTAGPGSVMAKKESYVNEMPVIQSFGMVNGREYEFKLVLQARYPGRYHIHPSLLVNGAGPLAGPGSWVEVSGSVDDFVYPLNTLTGETIPNLATWGMETVVAWQGLWGAIALMWMLWWLRRPLFMPRHLALLRGREDLLITKADMIVGGVLAVGVVALVYGGARWADHKYPMTLPLQGGKAVVDPLPETTRSAEVKVVRAVYDVPGRSMRMTLDIKNNSDKVLTVGEFTTANLRFVNKANPAAVAAVSADYPTDIVPKTGLTVEGDKPLAPGGTARVTLDATDAIWELERLSALITDPDNRFGGLLFLYDQKGNRHISPVYGAIVPHFTDANAHF